MSSKNIQASIDSYMIWEDMRLSQKTRYVQVERFTIELLQKFKQYSNVIQADVDDRLSMRCFERRPLLKDYVSLDKFRNTDQNLPYIYLRNSQNDWHLVL